MILNIALIISLALLLNYLFSLIKLPGLLGMIIAGVLLGKEMFNAINPELSGFLSEFKTVALIVILIRAGLGINKETLKKVGSPAIKMSFIPGVLEGFGIVVISILILGFSFIEAGMLGFIIAAVSPAVVVPSMLELKENGYGKNKEIPTLVLAGASLDDVFAITIFGVFTGLATGASISYTKLIITVPSGIILGAVLGLIIGYLLIVFFKKYHIRDTKKTIIFIVAAIVFNELTELHSIKQIIPIAGLLGVMAMGYMILEKYSKLAGRLSQKFNKVWVLAEILLFVYIGSEVDIDKISGSIIGKAFLIIICGLIIRTIGVFLSLWKSDLNNREKLFCAISYIPKATVQAAIGAVPLTLIIQGKTSGISIETGNTILALAVLSIIITAPIGAIGIKFLGPRLLKK